MQIKPGAFAPGFSLEAVIMRVSAAVTGTMAWKAEATEGTNPFGLKIHSDQQESLQWNCEPARTNPWSGLYWTYRGARPSARGLMELRNSSMTRNASRMVSV